MLRCKVSPPIHRLCAGGAGTMILELFDHTFPVQTECMYTFEQRNPSLRQDKLPICLEIQHRESVSGKDAVHLH